MKFYRLHGFGEIHSLIIIFYLLPISPTILHMRIYAEPDRRQSFQFNSDSYVQYSEIPNRRISTPRQNPKKKHVQYGDSFTSLHAPESISKPTDPGLTDFDYLTPFS